MNKNQDLQGLNAGQQVQIPPSRAASDDPTEGFDLTRKARQEALSSIKSVLDRAAQGHKTGRKQIDKALQALYVYSKHTDALMVSIIKDMYRIVQAMAGSEVALIGTKANVEALILGLENKEVITADEVKEISEKEILPKYLPARPPPSESE
jgi:predicted RNA polymerase sigma factor